MVLNVHRNHKAYRGRGEGGKGGMEVGGEGAMSSDESHFNVLVGSDGQSHRTVSTNHNLFPKQ